MFASQQIERPTSRPAPPAPAATAPAPAALAGLLGGGLGWLAGRPGAPEAGNPALRELANKLEVFALFHGAAAALGAVPAAHADPGPPLAELAARAARLPAYDSVWVTEGVGHARAVGWLAAGAPAARLRRELERPELPATARLPLHTGTGLALAEQALAEIAAGANRPETVRAALRRHLGRCRAAAVSGYELAVFEGLGFVARTLRSALVPEIDRALAPLAPVWREAFWHGAGRGLYLAAVHALPGSTPRAIAAARREPPNAAGRANAAAGLAWALTLVNLRHPEVAAAALGGWAAGAAAGERTAIGHGVASAVGLWLAGPGRERTLAGFLDHRPMGRGGAAAWRALVVLPCRRAASAHHRPDAGFARSGGPYAAAGHTRRGR